MTGQHVGGWRPAAAAAAVCGAPAPAPATPPSNIPPRPPAACCIIHPQEAKREIDEAIETAKAAAVPDASELWTNIYKGAAPLPTASLDGRRRGGRLAARCMLASVPSPVDPAPLSILCRLPARRASGHDAARHLGGRQAHIQGVRRRQQPEAAAARACLRPPVAAPATPPGACSPFCSLLVSTSLARLSVSSPPAATFSSNAILTALSLLHPCNASSSLTAWGKQGAPLRQPQGALAAAARKAAAAPLQYPSTLPKSFFSPSGPHTPLLTSTPVGAAVAIASAGRDRAAASEARRGWHLEAAPAQVRSGPPGCRIVPQALPPHWQRRPMPHLPPSLA